MGEKHNRNLLLLFAPERRFAIAFTTFRVNQSPNDASYSNAHEIRRRIAAHATGRERDHSESEAHISGRCEGFVRMMVSRTAPAGTVTPLDLLRERDAAAEVRALCIQTSLSRSVLHRPSALNVNSGYNFFTCHHHKLEK